MKPIISMKTGPRNYSGLVDLGNRVVSSMTSNPSFTTPLVLLATLSTAITDVVNAIAQRGSKSSHGTSADVTDLRQKSLLLHQLLKSEAQYVQATAQVAAGADYGMMASIINTSGFGLANPRSPQGKLEMVQNLHRFVSRQLDKNQVKLKWKKPLNVTTHSNVKEYKVLRSATTDISTAVEVGITTKTTFTDTNASPSTVKWTYWVIAYNNVAGVTSDPVTVDVLGV